ncbi:MAG: 4-alpha-glucanotransferase [Gammaproteobacteria bacterium]|nr:4-alpha-glucanotransferase [Gammaproteobacteria bacterium]
MGPVLDRRRAGILLHPTSLPGPDAAGTLGRDAYYFIDFLCRTGQTVWQVLPLNPPDVDLSPYQCLSAFAGNPDLISLPLLVDWGWFDSADLPEPPITAATRLALLTAVHADLITRGKQADLLDFAAFCAEQREWLDDYVLFRALRARYGGPWTNWPAPLRDRESSALAAQHDELDAELAALRFEQFIFFRQWREIRRYANAHGVRVFGDLPIFVGHDSADVWARRDLFRLDECGEPLVVAGAPPDGFSDTGQRWGNPLYDWDRLAADGFCFWRARLAAQFELFDLLRIDHFRGFCACWQVPARDRDGRNGRWVETPGEALFDALTAHFGQLALIAEDLGHITAEVHALRVRYGIPGMKVLQFGFDGNPANPYLPHNHVEQAVVYTGTHDNDTTLGWYLTLPEIARHELHEYLGNPAPTMPDTLLRMAYASVCRLAMLPMQDVLGLGSEHRMNTPNTPTGNWRWRFSWADLTPAAARHLTELARRFDRAC